MLLVGTNNVSNTADEIAEGIFEIVRNVREKLPDVYIVLPVCMFLTLCCFWYGMFYHQIGSIIFV